MGAGSAWAKAELIRVDAKLPVDLRADQVEYHEKTGVYQAEGEVEVVQGEVRVFADRLRLDANTLIAEADGKVRLVTPQQILTAEHMAVDLNAGTGKAYNSQVFVKSGHYYLRGEEIEKTGRDTYRLRNGAFTTCDGSAPAWEFTGKEMEVDLEGYGKAKDTAFRIRDFPIAWTPYLIFPAKYKRQSGLLAPSFGNSDRDGIVFSQPYFQTLGDDQDASLTLNYMSKRGLDVGLEYRYNLGNWSKGMFLYDFLSDDGQGQELFDKGQNAHPYNSRYWFRGKADHRLFNGRMNLKLDVDFVSDKDYLREFTFGHTGYDSSNLRLLRWFGRDLEPNSSTVRTSKLNLQHSWATATFNGTVIYYDDLTTDNDRTLQELPVLALDATRQPVGDTGLYFQMNSSYRYYYREEGSKGHITDLSPQISLPLNFNDYLELEPSFTIMPRLYSVSLDDAEDPTNQKTGLSQLWRFKINASTYLYRVMDFGSAENPFKIKHAMRPFITYNYQPSEEQEDVALLARRGQGRANT
ncbi:MAG: LPS assembly protein LptD, partial [Desulfarculaceae bacterium]